MSRGGRGFSRGGGRGGGRGGFMQRDQGPPDTVLEMGTFLHAVEEEMLCQSLMPDKVPYFNAPIYLQNKSVIGRVDEILGPINEVYFSVKMGDGMVASSFKKGDKVYIGGDKLLPLDRFLPKPKAPGGDPEGQADAVALVAEGGVHLVAVAVEEVSREAEVAEHQEDVVLVAVVEVVVRPGDAVSAAAEDSAVVVAVAVATVGRSWSIGVTWCSLYEFLAVCSSPFISPLVSYFEWVRHSTFWLAVQP
ncbi:Gar1/Naf1 RNA binding region-domain-containing protein [Trametes meyenii]|nr:Gar1/Naf1 RNA binding region-domain-containing protein [Trametes meyenii]